MCAIVGLALAVLAVLAIFGGMAAAVVIAPWESKPILLMALLLMGFIACLGATWDNK